jgi:hypothetical protein
MLSRFKASTWRMIASGMLGLALVSAGAAGIFAQHQAKASTTKASFSIPGHAITGAYGRSGSVNLATLPPATAAQIEAAGAASASVSGRVNRPLKTAAQLAAEHAYALAHPGSLPKAVGKTLGRTPNSYGGGLTPVLTSSANGISFAQSGCNCAPPDQAIAAAPGYVFEGVNNLLEVYTPAYAQKFGPWTPNQLFAPVYHSGDGFSDPQITFDAERAMYIITWLEIPASGSDYIDYAFSKTSTPSPLTNFWVYQFSASFWGAGDFCDYETLGYDYWGTHLTCILFNGNSFLGNGTVSVSTNDALAGSFPVGWGWGSIPTDVSCGTGCFDPAYRISPTMEDGVPQAEWVSATDAGYGVTSQNLTLCSMTNTHALNTGASPTYTCAFTSLGNLYDDPAAAAQPSGTGQVYPGVGYKQIAYRNGQLYFALPILINCGGVVDDGILWNIITPQLTNLATNNPQHINGLVSAFTQAGYWCYTNADSYMPTFMADNEGDAALVFNYSGAGFFPSIGYTGRTAADAPNTLGQGTSSGFQAVGGTGNNTTSRWGDYSACALTTNLVARGIMYCAGEYGVGATAIWQTFLYSLRLQ